MRASCELNCTFYILLHPGDELQCLDYEVLCDHGNQCVQEVVICDGYNDCGDGSDESQCE